MDQSIFNGKPVYTIDLNFQGIPGAIASYLVPHEKGAVLVECGPGSTLSNLITGINQLGYQVKDISDVLLTHIHLDHAGSAGWFSRQGANIHVHAVGAPHLMDPEKLLASAGRIYGDAMDLLWGEFLPVLPDKIHIPGSAPIEIYDLSFLPIDTPGHANHHFAYLFETLCFSGDIGGVRLTNTHHIRVPMPPPEFILEKWLESVSLLKNVQARGEFSSIAPTHFGIFDDPEWHLSSLETTLNDLSVWFEQVMPDNPSVESLNNEFLAWTRARALDDGMPADKIDAYEAANPSWMSAYGIQRYWRKYRDHQA